MPTHLPSAYRILPYDIDFRIPGFDSMYTPGDGTLAPADVICGQWYEHFVDRLIAARGRRFLPVCRMSDGEFLFALGEAEPDIRLPAWRRIAQRVMRRWGRWKRRGAFSAETKGAYHSGWYSAEEWETLRSRFASDVSWVSEAGVLAVHLSHTVRPFQECHFPALATWFARSGITLTMDNYVPFYFVYAALTGRRRKEVLGGRVLVIKHAPPEKMAAIRVGLLREGAAEVSFVQLSERRSMFDEVDVSAFVGNVDVVLLGAGLGKAHVLKQLAALQVPCIDAGYVFEVWADATSAANRSFCSPDRK